MNKKIILYILIYICFFCNSKLQSQNDTIHDFSIKSNFYLINTPIDSSLYIYSIDTVINKKDTFIIETKNINHKQINLRKYNLKHELLSETIYLSDGIYVTSYFENRILKDVFYYNGGREMNFHFDNNMFIDGVDDINRKVNSGYFWTSDSLFDSITQFIDSSGNDCFNKTFYKSGRVFDMYFNLSGKSPIYKFHKNGKLGLKGEIYNMENIFLSNWKMWNENGNLIREFNYNDSIPNMKEGLWSWWDEDGNLILQEKYLHDNLIDSKVFNKDPEILKNLNRN